MELNHEQVMEILPHRDPMLLIDTVDDLEPGQSITARLHVDESREIFKGHFPGEPVLPGVYTVEATAQAADILLMSMERYSGKIPLFLGIDQVKFRKKILPGDDLMIFGRLEEERIEKAIASCRMEVYVDDELAAETLVTLAMR